MTSDDDRCQSRPETLAQGGRTLQWEFVQRYLSEYSRWPRSMIANLWKKILWDGGSWAVPLPNVMVLVVVVWRILRHILPLIALLMQMQILFTYLFVDVNIFCFNFCLLSLFIYFCYLFLLFFACVHYLYCYYYLLFFIVLIFFFLVLSFFP